MNMPNAPKLPVWLFMSVWIVSIPQIANADNEHLIQFDLPPVAPAWPSEQTPGDRSIVTVELRLSSILLSPTPPTFDQCIVRCQARDGELSIADYAPRTETASDLATPIQIKQTDEKTQSFGISMDGSYASIARGKVGADNGNKKTDCVEYQRHAPVQAVTAAGTINRGRGVYFKLRWTSQQVLEGEKVFVVTFAVPSTWRGSLLDVSVIAQADRKTFGGLDHEIQTIGAANFVVAAYRGGDQVAAARAAELAEAEFSLRKSASGAYTPTSSRSLSSMLRQVAVKLDLEPNRSDDQWLGRLLWGSADPHLDKQITKLPMPVRIAALDYADSRDAFASLGRSDHEPTERIVVAKPPTK